jgi:hypothetical protein
MESKALKFSSRQFVRTRSLLILTDFSGSKFDAAAMRAIKETAVFDKPFVKKSALIGTLSLPRVPCEMENFSRRDFAVFSSWEEGLSWLVDDEE